MKYKAIRSNYGFRGKYWYEGDIVEIDKDEKVPHHFEPINGKEIKVAVKDDVVALSQLHATPKVNSGFAYQASETSAKTVRTAKMKANS